MTDGDPSLDCDAECHVGRGSLDAHADGEHVRSDVREDFPVVEVEHRARVEQRGQPEHQDAEKNVIWNVEVLWN